MNGTGRTGVRERDGDAERDGRGRFVPPTCDQVAAIERELTERGDAGRAAALLVAACYPEAAPRGGSGADSDDAAAVRAMRPAPDRDLAATRLRLCRAVDCETEVLYRHKDAGRVEALVPLRALGFLLLELGFTVAAEGGVDCADIEATVGRAYGLPGYG